MSTIVSMICLWDLFIGAVTALGSGYKLGYVNAIPGVSITSSCQVRIGQSGFTRHQPGKFKFEGANG